MDLEDRIQKLESQVNELQKENLQLEQEVANNTSLIEDAKEILEFFRRLSIITKQDSVS